MGAQKNISKEQKVGLLKLTCLFPEGNLMKLIKISILTTPTTANVETKFSVLILLSTKLRDTLTLNSLDKLM